MDFKDTGLPDTPDIRMAFEENYADFQKRTDPILSLLASPGAEDLSFKDLFSADTPDDLFNTLYANAWRMAIDVNPNLSESNLAASMLFPVIKKNPLLVRNLDGDTADCLEKLIERDRIVAQEIGKQVSIFRKGDMEANYLLQNIFTIVSQAENLPELTADDKLIFQAGMINMSRWLDTADLVDEEFLESIVETVSHAPLVLDTIKVETPLDKEADEMLQAMAKKFPGVGLFPQEVTSPSATAELTLDR